MSGARILLVGEDAPGSLARLYRRGFEALGASVRHYCDRSALERALPGARVRGLRRFVQPLAAPAFNRRMRQELAGEAADLVLVIKGQHVAPETVCFLRRSTGAPVVNYYPDDPFCARHTNHVAQTAVLAAYDACFTFQRHRIPDYLAAGARRVEYLPFARDAQGHRPAANPAQPQFDVVFIGNLDAERVRWLEPLAGFRLAIFGEATTRSVPRGSPLAGATFFPAIYEHELPEAFARGAISLNILRWGNYDAHNMRSFESPACGAFTLTSRSRELAELFREGEEIAFFDDAEDLVRKVRYYLEHPDERARIALAGYRRVERETYQARAQAMLQALEVGARAA